MTMVCERSKQGIYKEASSHGILCCRETWVCSLLPCCSNATSTCLLWCMLGLQYKVFFLKSIPFPLVLLMPVVAVSWELWDSFKFNIYCTFLWLLSCWKEPVMQTLPLLHNDRYFESLFLVALVANKIYRHFFNSVAMILRLLWS